MWNVTKNEFDRYESTFRSLVMGSDKVNGQSGRNYFMKSNLPVNVLGRIWQLSDGDCDGFLNLCEFIIASKLLDLCMSGNSLPNIVPKELRDSANSFIWGERKNTPINYDNLSELFRTEETVVKKLDVQVSYNTSPIYEIFSKLKSPNLDLIEGSNVKEYFLKSGLDKSTLAEIWEMSDKDMDGCLNISEFTTAYRLIEENVEKLREKKVVQNKEYPVDKSLIYNSKMLSEVPKNIPTHQNLIPGIGNDNVTARNYNEEIKMTSTLENILKEERSKVENYNELYKKYGEKEADLQNKIAELKSQNDSLRKCNNSMEDNIEDQKSKIEQMKTREKERIKNNPNVNSFNFFNLDDLYTSSNKYRCKESIENALKKEESNDLTDIFQEFNVEATSSSNKTNVDIYTNDTKEELDDYYKNVNFDKINDTSQQYDKIIIVESQSDYKKTNDNTTQDSSRGYKYSDEKSPKIYSSDTRKSVDNINTDKSIKEDKNNKNIPSSSTKKSGFKMKNPFKSFARGLSVTSKKNKKKENEGNLDENSKSGSNKETSPQIELMNSNIKLGSADNVTSKKSNKEEMNKKIDERKVKTPDYELNIYNERNDDLTNNIFDVHNNMENIHDKKYEISKDNVNICDSATEFIDTRSVSSKDDDLPNRNVHEYNPPLAYIAKMAYISEDCDFSFKPKDIINVTHKCNEFFYAEIDSIGDWFPCNYVTLYNDSPLQQFQDSYTLTNYYIALYENEVDNDDDIPFEEGDILYGVKEIDGWVQGYSNGHNGIFPRNYVQILNNINVKDKCTIINNYKSKCIYELNLNISDKIALLHRNMCGWCIGVDIYKNIGFFPSSCIYNDVI